MSLPHWIHNFELIHIKRYNFFYIIFLSYAWNYLHKLGHHQATALIQSGLKGPDSRDGSGQEILKTRQDETGKKSWNCFETRQVKTLKLEICIQDKSRQNGCASRRDKTLEFSKIYIRDKSRLTKILRFRDKTGRDKSLVLSWREISQDSED